MSKREFIDRLRAALNGRVPSTLVMDNINYYEEYINTEVRKGKTEEEVLASLGDPRLIAKTIIQTSGQEGSAVQGGGAWGAAYQDASYQDARGYGGYGNGGSYSADGCAHNGNHSSGGYEGGYADEKRHTFRLPVWLAAILSAIAVLAAVSFLVSVLSFLAPVIIIMAAVLFTVKLFRDWLN